MRACADIHGYMNQTIAKGLQSHGIIAPMVQGAFYNYPDFEPFREALAANGIKTSQDLHEVLLEEYNLATLPGRGFGAEDDVLTLRLSGCDYDGGAALAAYQAGEALDHAFVEKYAPHILKAIDLFGAFLEKYA
jgi:aspartate/methionine/tyrosine aminotransferase